jgi:hypothetical protein
VKAHCSLHGSKDFTALLAFEIGIENKTALIEALEQNHAHIGHSVSIHGGQSESIGIVGLRRGRLFKPTRKQPVWLLRFGKVTSR